MTADACAEDRQRCQSADMDDFLAKPVGFAQLQTLLEQWLQAQTAG